MAWATQGCKQSWTAAKDPAHEGGLLGNGMCGRGGWVEMKGGEGKQMRNKGLEWDGANDVRGDEGWGMGDEGVRGEGVGMSWEHMV
jgi:hypothetical protein